MGSPWEVDIWDDIDDACAQKLDQRIGTYLDSFNHTYSRFSNNSLVSKLSCTQGIVTVPQECVEMLRIYIKLFEITQGLFNPLIAQTLSDMGYDKDYSLKPKKELTQTPIFSDVVTVIDDTTISLSQPALIDIGAVGKGYAVDAIFKLLQSEGIQNFLVNGSGDMRHSGKLSAHIGLEHPDNVEKIIGTLVIQNTSIASSGSNRRRWADYHHIIDPHKNISPDYIKATWVQTESAAVADALATVLFLVPPDILQDTFEFTYVIVNKDMKVKKSPDWDVELFS